MFSIKHLSKAFPCAKHLLKPNKMAMDPQVAFLPRFEQSEEHIPPGKPTEETSQWKFPAQVSLPII